jgi:hypothetical protein
MFLRQQCVTGFFKNRYLLSLIASRWFKMVVPLMVHQRQCVKHEREPCRLIGRQSSYTMRRIVGWTTLAVGWAAAPVQSLVPPTWSSSSSSSQRRAVTAPLNLRSTPALCGQWCMHMGHSHEHHHHHTNAVATVPPPLRQRRIRNLRYSLAVFLLSIMTILQRVSLTASNTFKARQSWTTASLLGAALLLFWNPVASYGQSIWDRFSMIRSSIMKHSTPITLQYFFQNKSEVDRVTLLGYVAGRGSFGSTP